MGEKGARLTGTSVEVAAGLTETLAPLGTVTAKRMFGGNGVFCDGVMFALVDSSGSAFLRVSDDTRDRYETAGSESHGRMPYSAVPEAVLADDRLLREWAAEAVSVAKAAKA